MSYTPTIATLGYVVSQDQKHVLMIHRDTREDDYHFGKYNGLGGKLDPDEDVAACMRREIREEAGIECTGMRLRGVISWPGFGRHGEDWLGFIFLIDSYEGEPHERNREGTLEWIERAHLTELPMWEGAQDFLPMVFDGDPRLFYGVMPYACGRMQSWAFSRI
jgi:8-oxo-dGTP diphosphatase